MKKIVIFSGAGLDAESGVPTFRDAQNGLWFNYKIEEVATDEAWRNTPEKVLAFCNDRRKALSTVEPNEAHKALALLEDRFDVTNITQNISDLLERGGSRNVLHLHGELNKCRGVHYPNNLFPCTEDIKIGDKCPKGSQLRYHLVLFGEYPYNIAESYKALQNCDYLLIIGTSLEISYTAPMLGQTNHDARVFFIDPNPVKLLELYLSKGITYIEKNAVEGVTEIVNKILNNEL